MRPGSLRELGGDRAEVLAVGLGDVLGHLGARRAAGGLAQRGLAGVADDGLGSTGAHGQLMPARRAGRDAVATMSRTSRAPRRPARAAQTGNFSCNCCLAKRARVLATRLSATVALSVYKCSQTGVLLGFDNSLRGYGAFTLLAATF